jgi:hypothetical protein
MKPAAVDVAKEIRDLKAAEQDSVWIAEHYERLRKKYDHQFIAVYRRRVIDHDRDGARLARRLKVRHGETESNITVTYVTREKVDLLL